ncbi:tetratricopeptide repeat protein [Thiobaca trueperi]|uniref:Sel1 repeat-containing protein n=1 Tax=Thiobaca trueperi TaxID=127458 RepID=A0A4V2V186_9GAMM|nr:SEL1-like repeat protein [Thiobaca trueperi]TCT20232.1 Sel1 repeat-containing protein [Thiobaca trueperi]
MPSIRLSTAITITGLSRRTLWRRINEGGVSTLGTHEPGEETRLNLDDVLPLSSLPLEPEDRAILVAADRGDAVAQCDLAILLLNADRPAAAIPWFTLSARQFYADAMCFLGRCYLSGEGISRDVDTGLMWLSQAAAKGHPLAEDLMAFLLSPAGRQRRAAGDPPALDAALNDIERRMLLAALAETADPA